ncbi:DUF58 domain-containing protein [Rhodopirellula europaea]|uniref:Membrane protein containing DUF58 n=1 Tax=Rhodopirellula europaea SH398 TaxID=1263868 RepID=M5S7S3_9BACT|nr:DUF58 domain-containing protein [Rhodopirellula europaea]EMI27516.1 membrane protein containing DUF58 [Rhodopirellula europaea SH398]
MTDHGNAADSPSDPPAPSRWLTIIVVCAIVVFLGMVAGAGLWMTAAITVAAVVAIGNWVATQWSAGVVAVRLDSPEEGRDLEVVIGSLVPVTVEVTNQGKLPVAWVLAEDLIPRGATQQARQADGMAIDPRTTPLPIEGARLAVMALLPGQSKRIEYSVRCLRRGYFQIGPMVLETGDPVGMFRRYRLGARPMFVTVLPKVQLLSTYEIGSRRPIGEIKIRASSMTDPTRLRGIRQWQIGDPLRSVHWAATARTGTLHSKVYEPSSVAGATIILDLHVDTNPDQHEPLRTDLTITAAASIAAALHDAGEPFGLATNGRDAADRIRTEGFRGDHRVRDASVKAASLKQLNERLRPVLVNVDRGPVHLKEMFRTLARLERTDGLTLAEFLVETESQLSSETTMLVMLQQATEADIAALVGLSRRGWAIAVVINTLDIDRYSRMAGPLLAERIHVSHLQTEDSIMDVCRAQMAR